MIGSVTYLNQSYASPGTYEQPHEIDSFEATPVDAPDGLSNQFRIKANFPAVPPGAVDEAYVGLMFKGDNVFCDAVYRLRLHSARQFYDFRFRVAIDYISEPAKVKSTEEATKAAPN